MKRIISIVVLLCLIFSFTGCEFFQSIFNPKPDDPYANVSQEFIYGIDEPILETISNSLSKVNGKYKHTVSGFDMEITADIIGMLGVKSIRFRIPTSFMTTAGQYDEEAYEYLKNAYRLLKEAGVELFIGLMDYFPSDTGFVQDSARSVPTLDDEYYDDWMNSVTDLYYETAKLFPEITIWEMGNEMNSDNFFHPNGYVKNSGSIGNGLSGGFSYEDKVTIYTDYMYYAAKGIHKANPDNQAFTSGFAFTTPGSYISVEYYIRDVYDTIKGGKAPSNVDASERSTNPRDYFDGFCWHPYVPSKKSITEDWLLGNNKIYQAIIDNGDEGLPVAFTEFGFHDDGDSDLEEFQTEYMAAAYSYMLSGEMPYVISCCAFRLYQCQNAVSWGGEYQNYWGYFSEYTSESNGFDPRYKAIELQKLYGGTGDLYKYSDIGAE